VGSISLGTVGASKRLLSDMHFISFYIILTINIVNCVCLKRLIVIKLLCNLFIITK